MANKTKKEIPDPKHLLAEADKMPSREIGNYWQTVRTLRGKGYSWREIANWLTERGVPVHYKALERYSRKLIETQDEKEWQSEGVTSE
jgi:hypothetical protein